jgi:hypothetical protein
MDDELEVKRKPGRPRKTPFKSILSPEQIAALQTPDQIVAAEARARDAERKRLERQREREAKKIEAQFAGVKTVHDFWSLNRSLADQGLIDKLLAQQELVFDQLRWMTNWVNSSYNDPQSENFVDPSDTECYVSLKEGAADVAAFVRGYGICQMEVIWLDFWKQGNVDYHELLNAQGSKANGHLAKMYEQTNIFQMLTENEGPTEKFVRYGIIVGIPGHKLFEFEQFLATQKAKETATSPAPAPSESGWTTLSCKCGSLPEAAPVSISEAYKAQGKAYQCYRCRAAENTSREQSTLHQRFGAL